MKRIKFSHYNELIPVDSTDEYLLYNIFTGGLHVLDKETGKVVGQLAELPGFSPEEYPQAMTELRQLEEGGFFVPYETDERKLYQDRYFADQLSKFSNYAHIGVTIGTTITCNMGCPYCFEVVKPNKSLRDPSVVKGMVNYIENMINKAPTKGWNELSVIWYGGEPLINREAIRLLSESFIPLCEKYNIPYEASIITNGILLDKETWQFLKAYGVKNVQITIDGAREVHEKYRPLKNPKGSNYEKILENLSMMPRDMNATIRVNTDKNVAASLGQLLDDLRSYGIWPQRHKSVSIKLAWLRAYKGADTASMPMMTQDEFFAAEHAFRCLMIEKFSEWPGSHGNPLPRLKWKFPEKQSDCATYVSPYFFTFDPEGNIHKCWETVHVSDHSSGHTVFEDWNPDDFRKYLDYSRTKVHPVCYDCKYNPVCEGLSCAYDALLTMEEGNFPCTAWKTQLPSYFRQMYEMMKEHPDRVAISSPKDTSHQTHANK
jgi:uncharacterized protein